MDWGGKCKGCDERKIEEQKLDFRMGKSSLDIMLAKHFGIWDKRCWRKCNNSNKYSMMSLEHVLG